MPKSLVRVEVEVPYAVDGSLVCVLPEVLAGLTRPVMQNPWNEGVYEALGVSLTYHPDQKSVHVGAGAPHVLSLDPPVR